MSNDRTDFFALYDINGKLLTTNSADGAKAETGLSLGDGLSNKIKISLLEKTSPELRLYGVVNEDMANYVRQAIMFLEAGAQPPSLKATITSTGGSVLAGMEIGSILSGYSGGVHGHVQGYAYSAAAQYILMGCLIRYAHKYSRLLFHYVRASIFVSEHELSGHNRINQTFKDLKESNDQTVEIIMERTGRTEREVRKLLCKGHVMTAKECKDFGLIDVVYSNKVTKTVDPTGNARFKQNLIIEQ